tara:strand:- start:2665 stop:2928 length:264 start_codon:yes stop_codon:yes gene_type:complete
MTEHFGLLYINVDEPRNSEIYGIYSSYDEAVEKLLECANYREDENGELTQYMENSYEYSSLNEIRDIIRENNELVDIDIYRIEKVYL